MKARLRLALGVLLCVASTGCRHKQAPPPPVLAQSTAPPIALAQPPTSAHPPMVPEVKTPSPPAVEVRPRKRRPAVRKASPASVPAGGDAKAGLLGGASGTTAPIQMASAGPTPETSAIGELSAGGETNPKTQQEAAELIAGVQKRLDSLGQRVKDEQRASIEKIRRFVMQAQAALKSGDAEGAKTLATKASLLLDDLPK